MKKTTFGTNPGVAVKDWMKYRPYPNFANYDGYYLRLANQVFEHLVRPKSGLNEIFKRSELRDLAVILTSHFEDFVNEIGLWAALRRKNEQLYGRPIPFFDLADYDPEYLNPQDFQYLIWQSLGQMIDKTLNPFSPGLVSAGNFSYDFFEEKIDEAPVLDFYDKWLNFDSSLNFFELKYRMRWMAFENYLLAPKFSAQFESDLEEMKDPRRSLSQTVNPEQIAYTLQEDYLWKRPSHWCGMTAPEWFAEVARCPDALRPEILQTSRRVIGMFLFQDSDEKHYHFEYLRTRRVFKIHRDSVTLSSKEVEPGKDAGMMSLVFWQNDWWMSGIFVGWKLNQREIEKERAMRGVSFYAWSEEQQNEIRERTAELEQGFVEYFGSHLAFFPDEKTMSDALKKQAEWWNLEKSGSIDPSPALSKYKESQDFIDFDKTLGLQDPNGLAVFFVPGMGVLMSPLLAALANLMQKKDLTPEESKQLFYSFFGECEPSAMAELVGRFGMDKLRFPLLPDEPDFVRDNFLLLQHYYNPSGFGEVLPNMSLVNEQ